jgi:putative FmdB family regulatory protein
MPLYDYLCRKCDHTFEFLLLSSERPVCPKCGSGRLQKLMSPPAAAGKSAATIAAARALAIRAGHTSNYKRSKGKIVD